MALYRQRRLRTRSRSAWIGGPRPSTNARHFDATASDEIRASIGGANQTGALTIAALMRRIDESIDVELIDIHHTSGGGQALNFGTNSAHQVQFGVGGTARNSTTTVDPSDDWAIIAVTKAAGTTTPRAHIFKGGSWTHENMSGTLGNPSSQAGGTIRFATAIGLVWYSTDVAVVGEWTSELSDGQIEALSADSETQDWYDLTPVALWDFDQADVGTALVDLIGSSDQTSISGTTVLDDGPTWTYGVVGPTVHERSAALATTGTIEITAFRRDLVRQLAVSSANSIEIASFSFWTTFERSLALDAAGSITIVSAQFWTTFNRALDVALAGSIETAGSFWTTFSRALALDTTASIETAGQFWTTFSRSLALDLAGSISVAGHRLLERTLALDGTATIEISGQFWTTFSRSLALDAAGSIEVAGEFWTTFDRALELATAGSIEISGEIEAGATTHERSASLETTGTITIAAFRRDLLRSAACDLAGAITIGAFSRDHLRQLSVGATGTIEVAGEVGGVIERSLSLDVQALIVTGRQVAFARAAELAAAGSIEVGHQRVLFRSLALDAAADLTVSGWELSGTIVRSASLELTGSIETAGRRALLRSASLTSTGSIETAGIFWSVLERALALSTTADIQTLYQRVLSRTSSLSASGSIEVANYERELVRALGLDLTSVIVVHGVLIPLLRPWTYDEIPDYGYDGDNGWTFAGSAGWTFAGTAGFDYDHDEDWTYEPVTGA